MIQTSPVQRSYAPEGSGKKLFDEKVTEGNWYYYYQPTDWKGETLISAAATR